MEWVIGIGLYVLAGIAFDVFVHLTNPIVYWDGKHALISHAYLVLLWPLAVVSWIIHALRGK